MSRLILAAVPYGLRRRFDAGAAGDLEATFELRVRSRRGCVPARFTICVSEGRCHVRRGAARADAALTVGAGDLVRLVSRSVGWPELLSSGRLELSGNPFLGLRLPVLFRLPPTRRPAVTRRPARTLNWARSPRTRRFWRRGATS